jgi:hypothetical protein
MSAVSQPLLLAFLGAVWIAAFTGDWRSLRASWPLAAGGDLVFGREVDAPKGQVGNSRRLWAR